MLRPFNFLARILGLLLISHGPATSESLAISPLQRQKEKRAKILRAMESIMGPLPDLATRCPLEVKTESATDCDGYWRRVISYQVMPGHRVQAWLLAPKAAPTQCLPGVLALHQTSQRGPEIVAGLSSNPDDAYGVELARRGFMVLAPPYPLLGDYQPDLKALGFSSGTMLAIWINMRGLEVLESLPEVSRAGFGCIGHSLGGHNGLFTAAFDERIKAVACSSGLDSFRDYYGGDAARWEPGQGWCQVRYMPRLDEFSGRLADIPFDFDGVMESIAPRRIFLHAPKGDSNFRWQSVDRLVSVADRAHALYPTGLKVEVVHPDGPHGFPKEMREKAYHFLDAVLRPAAPQPLRTLAGEDHDQALQAVRQGWDDALGPSRRTDAPVMLEVLHEEQLPDFTRKHVRYRVMEDTFTDGYLLIPPLPSGQRTAGIVAFHSTVPSQAKSVAGLDESAPDKMIGVQLVKRGWVVLCPRCFIFNEGATYQENVKAMKRQRPNWTGMRRMLHDGQCALDVLSSLPEVDPLRLGAIGHSLGAKEALYLAAFDQRVRAAVFSEGGIGLRMSNWDAAWYLGPQVNDAAWKRDHEELLALISPRALLLIAGDSADTDASLHFVEAAQPVFLRDSARENLEFFNHREGHAYPPAAQQKAIEFLEGNLR